MRCCLRPLLQEKMRLDLFETGRIDGKQRSQSLHPLGIIRGRRHHGSTHFSFLMLSSLRKGRRLHKNEAQGQVKTCKAELLRLLAD